MSAYRWRLCPSCGKVVAAGALRLVTPDSEQWVDGMENGPPMRACPACKFVGPTKNFQLVLDTRRAQKRRCPSCGHEGRASGLLKVGVLLRGHWLEQTTLRACPQCRAIKPTRDFELVPAPAAERK